MTISDLERLYRTHFSDFVRVASAISGSEAVGAEAVQDAFAKAIKARKNFRGEAPLEGWVWRIVVNCARNSRAGEGRQERNGQVSPGGGALPADRDLEVLAWVAGLPERQREVVFLRYFADLDYRSIAAALEIEVGTVAATLNAAHKNLRATMEASL